MKSFLLSLAFLAAAPTIAAEPYHNSASYHEQDGQMIGEIDSQESGVVTVNGMRLELIKGKLYLNGELVYQGKGRVKAELRSDQKATTLIVNGKQVSLPAAK